MLTSWTKLPASETNTATNETSMASSAIWPPNRATTQPRCATRPRNRGIRPRSGPRHYRVQRFRQTLAGVQRELAEKLPPTGSEPHKIAGQVPDYALKLDATAARLWPIAERQRRSENTRPSTR